MEYKDIKIDESNLDWMGDSEEKELMTDQTLYEEVEDKDIDLGPSSSQVFDEEEGQNLFKSYGLVSDNNVSVPKKKINTLHKQFKNQLIKQNDPSKINFPYVSEDAIDEFDCDIKLFFKLFPWLYPGGIGDFNEFCNHSLTLQDYFTQQLRFFDGSFVLSIDS